MSKMTGKPLVNLHEAGFKSQLAADYFHESIPKTVRLYRSRGIKDADKKMVVRGKYLIRKYLEIIQNKARRGVGVSPWQFSYDTLDLSEEEALTRSSRLGVSISNPSLVHHRKFIIRMSNLPASMLRSLRNKPEKIRNGKPKPQTSVNTSSQIQPCNLESYPILTSEDKKRFARETLGMNKEEAFQLALARGWNTTRRYFSKRRLIASKEEIGLRFVPARHTSPVAVAPNSQNPLSILRDLYRNYGVPQLKAWVDDLIHEADNELNILS